MVVTVLLLLLLAWLVDLRAALTLFREADWRWIVVCLIVVQIQIVLSAIRWQRTAVRLGQSLSVPRAVREYYLATLGNLSLPGGVTGDAARIYRNRQVAGTALSAQSVLIERLAGQLALLLVTLCAWLLWPFLMAGPMPAPMSALGGQLLIAAVCVSVSLVVLCVLLIKFATSRRVSRFVQSLGPALRRAWITDKQWLVQGGLSLAVVATYLLVFALCALALKQPLSVLGVVAIVPLVLLSMVIPLTIGGWGVREAVAATLLPVMGLSVEAAVASSVLYGLVSMLGSVPGAVWAGWRSPQN